MKSLLGKLFGGRASDEGDRLDRFAQLMEENTRLKQAIAEYANNYGKSVRYLNGMLVRSGGEAYLDEITQEAGANGSIAFEADKVGGVLLKFVPKEGVAA